MKEFAPRFGAFLQSWEWGEFQQAVGRKVERVLIEGDGGVMVAQAVQLDLPFGWRYWMLPKGPLGSLPMTRMLKELKRGLFPPGVFVRVEPAENPGGWPVKDMHPSTSSVIDLTQGMDAIVAGMKQKTRYNIRLAEKKGVTVRIAGAEAFEDFQRLMEQTAVRDHFSLHPMEYYRTMLTALQGDVKAFLAFADYDGRPLAVTLMIDFLGQRTYLHGASSNLHRNVMAPYLLHQELMKDAIAKGMTTYDLYGVAPVGSGDDHPWAGITRFKQGFGGETVSMPGTFEVPLSMPTYLLFRAAKMLQRFRRRK